MTEVKLLSQAACKDEDTNLFFTDEGPMSSRSVRISIGRAKTICEGCLVKTECLMEAINNYEMHGIWGGLTGKERSRIIVPDRPVDYKFVRRALYAISNRGY